MKWCEHGIPTRSDPGQAKMCRGHPVLMYTVPQVYGAEDKLKTVNLEEVAVCKDECISKSQFPCDETVFELCVLLMQENGWDAPTDAFDAAELYTSLRTVIMKKYLKMGFTCPHLLATLLHSYY